LQGDIEPLLSEEPLEISDFDQDRAHVCWDGNGDLLRRTGRFLRFASAQEETVTDPNQEQVEKQLFSQKHREASLFVDAELKMLEFPTSPE
jgi:hypothetical protein